MVGFFKKLGRTFKHGFHDVIHTGEQVGKGIGHGVVYIGEGIAHGAETGSKYVGRRFKQIGRHELAIQRKVIEIGTPIVDVVATGAEIALPIAAAIQPEFAPELLGAATAIKAVHEGGHQLHKAHRANALDLYTGAHIGTNIAAGVIQGPQGDVILRTERLGHNIRSQQRAGTYDVTSGVLTGLQAAEIWSDYKLATTDPESEEYKTREKALKQLGVVTRGAEQVDELYKQDRLGPKEAGAVGVNTIAEIMTGTDHKLSQGIGKEIMKSKIPDKILDASRREYEQKKAQDQVLINQAYTPPETHLSVHPEEPEAPSQPLHSPCVPIVNNPMVLPAPMAEMHNYVSGVSPSMPGIRPTSGAVVKSSGQHSGGPVAVSSTHSIGNIGNISGLQLPGERTKRMKQIIRPSMPGIRPTSGAVVKSSGQHSGGPIAVSSTHSIGNIGNYRQLSGMIQPPHLAEFRRTHPMAR